MFIKLIKKVIIEEKTIVSFSSTHMMMEYVERNCNDYFYIL